MSQGKQIIEEQLIDLEVKLAYQEDLLQSLNTIVAEQNARMATLEKKIEHLAAHLKEVLESNPFSAQADEEVPPHY